MSRNTETLSTRHCSPRLRTEPSARAQIRPWAKLIPFRFYNSEMHDQNSIHNLEAIPRDTPLLPPFPGLVNEPLRAEGDRRCYSIVSTATVSVANEESLVRPTRADSLPHVIGCQAKFSVLQRSLPSPKPWQAIFLEGNSQQ